MNQDNYREYEIFYFTSITMESEDISRIKKEVSEIITKNEGEIKAEEEVGKKKLAYMVGQTRHGYFIWMRFNMLPEKLNQVNHEIKLIPEILRHKIMLYNESYARKIDLSQDKAEYSNDDKLKKDELKPKIKTEEKKTIPKEEEKPVKVDLDELDLKIDKLLSETENEL